MVRRMTPSLSSVSTIMDKSSLGHKGDSHGKQRQLVRVTPRYVRLRQGSEIRYHMKLLRPPSKVSNRVAASVERRRLTM